MGLASEIYLQKQQVNTQQKPIAKQPIQTTSSTIRQPHILNPVADIVRGVQNTAPQLPQMGVDFIKSGINNLTPSGIGNTLPALARGAATGIVDLAPSVAGLGVDVVNSVAGQPIINMPEERRRPLGYAFEQWRDIQDTQNNLAKRNYTIETLAKHPEFANDYKQIKPANSVAQWISGNTPGAENAQFAETLGQFAAPLGVINAGIKGTKVASDAARIASKLNTAQKAKYASQIDKLAKKNVANNIKPLTPAQEVWKNTKLGAGLGALEGEGLEERAGNAFGMGALGLGLGAMHIGGKKAWNSAKGKEIRAAAKEGLNIAADKYPGLSQGIAFLDSVFKTNLSKEGSLTDKRRRVLNESSKNRSLAKNISDRAKSILDETRDLNKKEQKKIQNINQYGKKTYNQQTENGTKEFNSQEPIKETTQEQNNNKTENKYEFMPEEPNQPMEGSSPQPEINPQKPKFTNKEKRDIKKQAEQHRKETNNFKFPEEDPGERIHQEIADDIARMDREKAEREAKEQAEVEARRKRFEELKSKTSESNLSHVEEQTNTNLPKKEPTAVKNDSGMADNIPDGYYKDEFGYIKKNKVSKPYTPEQKTPGIVKAGSFQEINQKKQFKNKANEQLKNDLKTGSFKESNIKEPSGESIVRLKPGEAQGANYLYEKTVGKGNIFENVEKDTPSDRTVGMDEAHKNKLKKLSQKYEVIEDPKTNKNIIVNKSTGKPITPEQRKALAKYFDEYKENNREISAEDRVRAEIEESAEDEVYYDKYKDNLSPTEGEGSTGVERFGAEYKSKNPEFIKWYSKYKKLPDKAKGIALKKKLQEYKNDKKGLEEFYDEFVKQEESDLEATRQRKIGDEYSDISDIQETERLSEAVKDTEFDFKREPVEKNEPIKRTPAFQKLMDSIWKERVKGLSRKIYFKGSLNRARTSEQIQTAYDKLVKDIKESERTTLVKQAMIEDLNTMADKVIENKKVFGVKLNKLENFNIHEEVMKSLQEANERGDIPEAQRIIKNNQLKIKYEKEKGSKVLNEHYMQSANSFYRKIDDMGLKLKRDNNGQEYLEYNAERAKEWCIKQAATIYNKQPEKLAKEVSMLNKRPDVVKNRILSAYEKLFKAEKNVLENDIKFAYDKPQKSLKKIDGAKGTEKQWELRETGDVRSNESSDIGEAPRKVQERTRALESVIPKETDNTKPAISGESAELAKNLKVVSFDTAENTFKGKIKSVIARIIFSNFRRHGLTVVTKDVDIGGDAAYKKATGEILIKEGLPDDVAISKTAHEYMHKLIYEAVEEGGEKAINTLYQIFDDVDIGKKFTELSYDELTTIRNNGIKKGLKGEKLSGYEKAERRKLQAQKAVAKLNELLDNNRKANNKYRTELKKLYNKYGEDYVEKTLDLADRNVEKGLQNTEGFSEEQKNIFKESFEIEEIRNTEIENFCNDIESKVLNEQRQGISDRRPDSNTKDSYKYSESVGRTETTRSTEGSEQTSKQTEKTISEEGRQNQSNVEEGTTERQNIGEDKTAVQSGRTKIDDLELSTKNRKVFDFFKNKKVENDKNNPINKIDNGKVNRVTDFFEELSNDRENDFKEYGTFSEEQMKNRLFQQSLTGEGIYTMKGSKGEGKGKLDLSRENKPKIGFSYEKTKQGLGYQGTVESQLSRMLTDQVRRSHARSQVELLKELFSKKEKGFEAVNSKILWNAIYFGKSKAWYDFVSKGKRSIRNAFDKENARVFEELFDRVNGKEADIYVPKDILDVVLSGADELPLDYLSSYGKFKYGIKDILKEASSNHKNKTANLKKMTNSMGESMRHKMKGLVKLAGASLDFYNDRFKRKVLTSASFIMNNRIGNQIMLMANSDSIKDYIDTWKDAATLKEDSIPREILESTLSEALNNEANNRVKRYFSKENGNLETFSQIMDGQYVDLKTIESLPKKIWYGALNTFVSLPNDIFKRISHKMGEVNERMERFERKQATSLALKKINKQNVIKTARSMAAVEELAKAAQENKVLRQTVIDKVNNILGDYNSFNKYEQNVLKRVQPFYAWNRTIIRHILNLYKEDPVKATLILYETYRLRNQDDGLEDYQHGAIKLPFKNKRTGTNIVINKTKTIPYSTPFEWFDGEGLGTLSPTILKPLEAIRGEKFFKGNPEITNKKWKKATQNKVKGYYNNKTGEFREGGLPLGARLGYLGKDLTEVVYPALGSPLTKGNLDAIRHKVKTGEFLFPDKQYDSDFGGFYHGDKAGIYKSNGKTYTRERLAKNRLDLIYQALNKYGGLGIQPERAKEEVKERKKKFSRKHH